MCSKFVKLLGLKTLFSAFMKKVNILIAKLLFNLLYLYLKKKKKSKKKYEKFNEEDEG